MIRVIRFPLFIGKVTSTKGLLSLVCPGVNAAIYRKDSSGGDGVPTFDGYEVVKYKEEPFSVYKLGGAIVIRDAGFNYPSNEAFGRDGFAYRKLSKALVRYKELEYGTKINR